MNLHVMSDIKFWNLRLKRIKRHESKEKAANASYGIKLQNGDLTIVKYITDYHHTKTAV